VPHADAPPPSATKDLNRHGARPMRWGHYALMAANTIVCAFLLAPIVVVVIVSFSADEFMQFPPSGWSLRWYEAFFADRRLINGFMLSVSLAVVTALVAGILGSMSAYALTRSQSRFVGLARSLLTAPLVTPGVVVGLAMLIYLSAIGLRGSFLTLLVGHVVLSIPFVVLIVSAGLQSFDRSIEDAAVSLGANRTIAFLTVTIPAVKISMVSGGLFAFLNSLDEVVVTLFLPGPRTRTLPVAMFDYVQHNLDPLPAAISTILIAIALTIVFVTARFGAIGRLMGNDGR
jgi:putative spermidine/putrescine transport system permease protein